eukprot:366451-Chlamydomonas_euryale.AAC.10
MASRHDHQVCLQTSTLAATFACRLRLACEVLQWYAGCMLPCSSPILLLLSLLLPYALPTGLRAPLSRNRCSTWPPDPHTLLTSKHPQLSGQQAGLGLPNNRPIKAGRDCMKASSTLSSTAHCCHHSCRCCPGLSSLQRVAGKPRPAATA